MAKGKAQKKKGMGWHGQIFMVILCLLGVIFSATSVLLIFGMLPTFVAIFIDRTKEKLKPLTVGAMNLAGCFPFILELWMSGTHDVSSAIAKVMEPRTIVVIYLAAAIGYMIDWAMTGIVSSIMYQKGLGRLADIEKLQKGLLERWGPEVTGEMQLDEYGFPVDREGAAAMEQAHASAEKAKAS